MPSLFFLVSPAIPLCCAQQNPLEDPRRAVMALMEKPITDEEFQLRLSQEDETRVGQLILKLGAPEFAERERAAGELIEIGAAAMAQLRNAYHTAEDFETKLWIEQVVRTAYLNYHVLDQHGFLGISMQPYTPGQAIQDPRRRIKIEPDVPKGRVGVAVWNVIENTGAARAGIQFGDVLIGINGVSVEGTGPEISERFSAEIRRHKPGKTVELEVVRGSEVLMVEATLGRPPESVARNSNILVVTDLYRQTSERFKRWWELYFLNSAAAEPRDP